MAPCTPVQETSPAARRCPSVVRAVAVDRHAAAGVVRRRDDRDRARRSGRSRTRGSAASGPGSARGSSRPACARCRAARTARPARACAGGSRGRRRRAARARRRGGPRAGTRLPAASVMRAPSPRSASVRRSRPLRMNERGRMELDVLEVQEPRARAPRHRDAVAARALRVGRVQVDLPEAAGREDRLPREERPAPRRSSARAGTRRRPPAGGSGRSGRSSRARASGGRPPSSRGASGCSSRGGRPRAARARSARRSRP